MSEKRLKKLVDGYKEFYKEYMSEKYEAYRSWASNTQKPETMVISCSDSRVIPAIITKANLGDIFMVSNVANLVPPYGEKEDSHHGTSAALEFAVNHLKVKNIIILGHSGCGGIKALMQGSVTPPENNAYSFIVPWVSIAQRAKDKVLQEHADLSEEEKQTCCEKEALKVSLANLKTFPWIESAINKGDLMIHAWHFDIASGVIESYKEDEDKFSPLLEENDKQNNNAAA